MDFPSHVPPATQPVEIPVLHSHADVLALALRALSIEPHGIKHPWTGPQYEARAIARRAISNAQRLPAATVELPASLVRSLLDVLPAGIPQSRRDLALAALWRALKSMTPAESQVTSTLGGSRG